MDSSSNEKALPKWFYPLTAAVNIFSDVIILFAVIVHLSHAHASEPFYSFVAFDFSVAEFVAAVLLVGVTVFSGIIRSNFGTPAKLTVGTFIYHTVVMVTTVFVQYFYDLANLVFPYPVLAVIPFLTTVLSLWFFFTDVRRGTSEPKRKSQGEKRGKTFSAITESSYSDYIDDLSPAPRKAPAKRVTVKKKRTGIRSGNLKPKQEKASKPAKPVDKSEDYSNDVKDLFSGTSPAFSQSSGILESLLEEKPKEADEKPKKQDTSKEALMEEFPEIPEEEKKGSVFEKPAGSTKLSSSDASEALRHHDSMK